MIQKFMFGQSQLSVWTAKDKSGRLAVAIVTPGAEVAAAGMTPDEALELAAALERAAFMQRRAQAVETQRARAETGFVEQTQAQRGASFGRSFLEAFLGAKCAEASSGVPFLGPRALAWAKQCEQLKAKG